MTDAGGGNFTNPPDLLIDNECHVGIGWFGYNNVNIISGGLPGNRTHGKLIFVEDRDGTAIEFFAKSIVVEKGAVSRPGRRISRLAAEGDVSPSISMVRTRALVEQA